MSSKILGFAALAVIAVAGLLFAKKNAPVARAEAPSQVEAPRAESAPLQTAQDTAQAQSSLEKAPSVAMPFQDRLLETAFAASSAMPSMPHLKSRARAQEQVVVACLELGQADRARKFIDQVENWRRAAGYADLGYFYAQSGDAVRARQCLEVAAVAAESMVPEDSEAAEQMDGLEGPQDWRRDRIRAKVARAYLALGSPEQASLFEVDLETSERGIVEAARLEASDTSDEQRLRVLGEVAASGDLDQVRNALTAGVRLFEAAYAEPERRGKYEERLLEASAKAPPMMRIDTLARVSEVALKRQDPAKALELAKLALETLDANRWAPEDGLPARARIAALRLRAGELEAGRKELTAVRDQFEAALPEIPDLRRARILVPIAEAYLSVGDRAQALTLYKRAAREGSKNPNARPRAEDLTTLCCSLAQQALEPDPELWTLIAKVQEGLRDPW